MERRSILKRIGAVSAATLAAGTVSASRNDDGGLEMNVYDPEQDETVTVQDDCICYDGCANCNCPTHCDACIC